MHLLIFGHAQHLLNFLDINLALIEVEINFVLIFLIFEFCLARHSQRLLRILAWSFMQFFDDVLFEHERMYFVVEVYESRVSNALQDFNTNLQ